MMLSSILLLIAVAALILLEGFFSGAEAAVISCDKVAVQQLAKTKHRGAMRLQTMLNEPERLVATTLLGTNLCVVSNSVVATVLATSHYGLAAPVLVTVILGPLVFFFGELLPKVVFQQKADRLALAFSGPLRAAQVVLRPLSIVLLSVQHWIVKGNSPGAGPSDSILISRDQLASPSRDELLSLRRLGPRAVSRVIQFYEKRVEDIMVDISQVVSVSPDTGVSRAKKMALQKGMSRLLVHSGQISNPVGFVHISALHAASPNDTVGDRMSHLLYAAEAEKCPGILKEMQRQRVQMAAIVNEYGACVGIVTLEDLMEEIFGEIRDELDRSPRIDRHPQEGYIEVDAYIGITEMKSMLDVTLPSGRFETLAGYLIEQYGAIPGQGTEITANGRRFVIQEADERRIRRVRVFFEKGELSAQSADENAPRDVNGAAAEPKK
ncbi:MAG: HlyC/CorC family transporter [Candidatus Coatesbacteria bacterium]|nr:HlyC/CorC family transporter [Candidatus Coatesbacteria bacterium]